MRLYSYLPFFRTFFNINNITSNSLHNYNKVLQPSALGIVRNSMPILPFLSSLLTTSCSSSNMSYPIQKSDEEWRAILSNGIDYKSKTMFVEGSTKVSRAVSCFKETRH